MNSRFDPVSTLRGELAPPADKSISHRAALFAAMCDEPVTITNYLDSEDTRSTLDAIQALGAAVDQQDGADLVIRGVGLRTPAEVTGGTVNVGNAGTLLRLLPGWLAGQTGGVWTLEAGILPENEASVRMHERCGFRIVGRRERLGRMAGEWCDVLLLERRSRVVG